MGIPRQVGFPSVLSPPEILDEVRLAADLLQRQADNPGRDAANLLKHPLLAIRGEAWPETDHVLGRMRRRSIPVSRTINRLNS